MSIWDFRQAIEQAIPLWAIAIPVVVLVGALVYRARRERHGLIGGTDKRSRQEGSDDE